MLWISLICIFIIDHLILCNIFRNTKVRLEMKPIVPIQKLCKICKITYESNNNFPNSCRFHKGKWMGAENSKHMGTRSGGHNKGLSLFWDCCDQEEFHGIGCQFGYHKSYDEL